MLTRGHYYIGTNVKLHYGIVLCGAERVKTISIQNLQSLCFDGVRLADVAELSRYFEARSPVLARLPRPGDRAGFLFEYSTLAEPTGPQGRPARRLGLRLPAGDPGEYRPAPQQPNQRAQARSR